MTVDPRQRALFEDFDAQPVPAGPPLNERGLPGWFEDRLAQEEDTEAAMRALFDSLRPRPKRLIVSKPYVATVHEQRVLTSGLYMPDRQSVFQREFGLRCTILKMNSADIEANREDGVCPGVDVIIPEHSGHPVYLGRETPWWVISIAEVMAVVEDDGSTQC